MSFITYAALVIGLLSVIPAVFGLFRLADPMSSGWQRLNGARTFFGWSVTAVTAISIASLQL